MNSVLSRVRALWAKLFPPPLPCQGCGKPSTGIFCIVQKRPGVMLVDRHIRTCKGCGEELLNDPEYIGELLARGGSD